MLEDLVLAYVTGNHLLDLLAFEEQAETASYDSGVVGDGSQAGDSGCVLDLLNQCVGYTRETESTAEQCTVGLHVFDGGCSAGIHFVDLIAAERRRKGAREAEICLLESIAALKYVDN